jgi:hypothetical protein
MRIKVTITIILLFAIYLNGNSQTLTGTKIILNATSAYGGDSPTDNANYDNVLCIGGTGPETGLKIFKQYTGNSPSFIGPYNYNDSYVFEMTDSNSPVVDGGIVFAATGNDDLFKSLMAILGNGKIGIGTTSPGYKLDVVGTIRAQEVKVDMDGADFVFEDDYPLQTLSEVETFIKENKHLPDIAPAKEMQENGISVGEINAKLLQKIEELTLYVIEIKKENKVYKNKTKQLENRLSKLESH